MASLNLCQFIGHCGADPEVRTFDNGNKIATTRIAVSERYTDRNQQPQERTEWISLTFSGKLADLAEKYIRKGSTIYVSGKWHNREWTDQQGNKRNSTELTVLQMQLLDKREQQTQNRTAPTTPAQAPVYQQQPQYPPRPTAPAPVPTATHVPQTPPPAYQPPQDDGPDLPF